MYMKDNGKTTKETVEGNNSGRMVLCMKDIGRTTWHMGMVDLSIQMEIYTKESGLKTRPMEKALIYQSVEPSMWEIGWQTNKMDKERKPGQIKQSIWDPIKMGRNMEKENSCGLMIVPIKEISSKTTSVVVGNTSGKMDVPSLVNGKIIKCREKESLYGQMVGSILETMSMIANKAMEYSPLKMAESMKDSGSMENSMEMESIKKKNSPGKEYGKMERELNG